MNKIRHPFDPSLQPVFSGQAVAAAMNYRLDGRHLFYVLLHINEQYEALPLVHHYLNQHLLDTVKRHAGQYRQDYQQEPIADVLKAPAESIVLDAAYANSQLRQCAPVMLTEPCWLQSVSQAAVCQTPPAVKLMGVYLQLTRNQPYLHLYRAWLLAQDCRPPPINSWAFAQQAFVGDCFFDFAAIQLAFASFSRVFFPELIGFTLAYCQKPALTDYFGAAGNRQTTDNFGPFFSARKFSAVSRLSEVIAVTQDYLRLFAGQAEDLWQRIQTGFWLYQEHNQRCCRHLKLQSEHIPSPRQALAELLRSKTKAAFGHHGKIMLAGKSLDDWFAQIPFDSESFLAALRESPYIDKSNPANSPLLKLFEFNGPMFGVVNAADKETIKNWLCSEGEGDRNHEQPDAAEHADIGPLKLNNRQFSAIDYAKLANRELYYYLVNADLFPEVLAMAAKKADAVLRWAGLCSRLPFNHYSHQAFDAYIAGLYQKEVQAYEPLSGTPKLAKKIFVWGIEQFAPTILTDGCWLQNANQAAAFPEVNEILFSIFSDETGNGRLEQNHPYIYRQLLDSLNIDLPPIHSKEFIKHPGFISGAFDIPVYLLAISKCSGRFLPELLGLNMAIELSGLGRVYLRLAEELRYWGINPAIVNIHITIDNVGSGHAAQAKNAIQLYLDHILIAYGEPEMHRHWQRIYRGFRSLQVSASRFAAALTLHYLWNAVADRHIAASASL